MYDISQIGLPLHIRPIETFSDVTREHVLAYAATLQHKTLSGKLADINPYKGRPEYTVLSVFFQDTTAWGWE